MTQVSEKRSARRGRIFPECTISTEELAKRKAERAILGDRCRKIFDLVSPRLLEEHYNWFIAIEPESEEYLIDPKLEDLLQKVRSRYHDTGRRLTTFRLNETGTCGYL